MHRLFRLSADPALRPLEYMKTVMACGTFDNLHQGHISYLEQAKAAGDRLIVVVARDINVEKIKGKRPKQNENERLAAIKKLKIADIAVLGSKADRLKPVVAHQPDIIFLGYDQPVDIEKLKNIFSGKILRGQPYKENIFKSSKLNTNRSLRGVTSDRDDAAIPQE